MVGVSYMSPVERSGLEMTGRTLNHDVLPMQTHQAPFCVPARSQENVLGKDNQYIPTVCWGRPTRNLTTVCVYVSPALGTCLHRALVLKDDVNFHTLLGLPLEQPVEPVYLFPGSTQTNF